MLWVLVGEVGECNYGIAWLGHSKLHIRSLELIIVLYRKLHHPQSIKFMDKRLAFFQWILRTHHKPDLIQIGTVM